MAVLDTWTVVHTAAAKFKPLVFPVSGFALSNVANILIFMVFEDFCCVVSCFILCVVPPGVYIVYYFKNWVVSFVMYVVHMDSFFTDFIPYSLLCLPKRVQSLLQN
jgi:hypothetical protein